MLYDSHLWPKNGHGKDEEGFYRFDKYGELRSQFSKTITDNSFSIFSRKGYCVLINYTSEVDWAPYLINKRAGLEAQILYAASFEHGIPNYIDDDLAEKIYFLVDIGKYLPSITWERTIKKMASYSTKEIVEKTKKMPKLALPSPLSLELGAELMHLIKKDNGAELLEKVKRVRDGIAHEMGLVIPKLKIVNNLELDKNEYCICIKGTAMATIKMRAGHVLCIEQGSSAKKIAGEETLDPAFGLPALWIQEERGNEAASAGYCVVDHASIIATHLTQIVRKNAAEILSLEDTQTILNTLGKEHPTVVKEALHPKHGIGKAKIHGILRNLLREGVSIRDMATILESIVEWMPHSRVAWFLTEKARQAIGRQICHQYACKDRKVRVLVLLLELEKMIIDSKCETIHGVFSGLDLPTYQAFLHTLGKAVRAMENKGYPPVLLCSDGSRLPARKLIDREFPDLAVISTLEVPNDFVLLREGVIAIDNADTSGKGRRKKASSKPSAPKA